jgi:hypothetical protein
MLDYLTCALVVASLLIDGCDSAPASSAAAPAPLTPAAAAIVPLDDVLLLFTDLSLFASFDNTSLRLEMHRPEKGPLAIWPTEPWETMGNSCYNHVLQVRPGENRMYYDCIESCLHSNCTIYGAIARRICLATSVDGLTWEKPALGFYSRNGSTANNILLEDSGVGGRQEATDMGFRGRG